MRAAIIAIFLIFVSAYSAFAQEQTQKSIKCTGTWTLINDSGWAVRNKEGIILPLSHNTEIIGCSKKPLKLNTKHAGRSVEISCQPSKIENGLPNITKIIIICK